MTDDTLTDRTDDDDDLDARLCRSVLALPVIDLTQFAAAAIRILMGISVAVADEEGEDRLRELVDRADQLLYDTLKDTAFMSDDDPEPER